MNEQHSHIAPAYYTGIQQSGVDDNSTYQDKLSHWNIGSFGPSSYPTDVHEHYMLKGNVKEEKQPVYPLDLHHSNERQWCPTTWVSDIPSAANVSKLEGRNNRQLPLVHSSYVSNTKINDNSYCVSSYSPYNQIENAGDVALASLSPDGSHGPIHPSYSENLQYNTNSKFHTKTRKILKTKYYYGETDGNWSCQNLDNPNEQMYEHFGSEMQKNVTIGSQFVSDAQNYNKQVETCEQQRNCRSASSVEDIHHSHCDNWNVSSAGASDKIIPVIENSASMPLLEKVDRKITPEGVLETPRVDKSSIYTELKTYTPREREMPVLECMLEPYGSQCSLNAQTIGENPSEASMEIPPTTQTANKNENDSSENLGNINFSSELPKVERKTNPRTQAIRNMKRMRTSFYMKLDEQIGNESEKPMNCAENNEIMPVKTTRPKKARRSRRKCRPRRRFTLRRRRKVYPRRQLVRFHNVYIAADIDTPLLENIGKEQLVLKKLPNSVFEQYKLFNGADIEKYDALPESLPALKMTLRITRHGNTNYNTLENVTDSDMDSQDISSVEIAAKDCKLVPETVAKHEICRSEIDYKDNDTRCSNTMLPNVRLPLKLKIKLPNRHLLNYKNDIPDQVSLMKQSHLRGTRERKSLRRKSASRNKNITKQTSGTTRTKRSTVDYGQDAYYHLLNYEELWDVFDEEMCESKDRALAENLVVNSSNETAQQTEDSCELFADSKKDSCTSNDLWEAPLVVKDEVGQVSLVSDSLPSAKTESSCSKDEQYLPCEVEPSLEIDGAKEANSAVQSTARKSILLSVKGDEIYDFIFEENAKEQSAKDTSAKFWENDSTNDAAASSQIVCDNISEENQKVEPQDMFIMTKMSHSGFFLNSDCSKCTNSMPPNNIAQSAPTILPVEAEYSVESSYQHSLLPCPERQQVQPEMLRKDYRDYESSFMARDDYQYSLHDIQKSRSQSVIETGYCNPSTFTGDTKHLEVSIYHKITPLNEEKT